MSRIKQLIILLLPTLLVVSAIYLVKKYNRGTIIIHNSSQSIMTIKDQQYPIDNDEYSISLWPDEYNINIKKLGYQKFSKSISLNREDIVDIYPNLIFIPIVKELDGNIPYIIPDEYKAKNEENDIIYRDNQAKFAFNTIKKKTLENLPNNISLLVFSRNGENALIITTGQSGKIENYYYYNVKTSELLILENNINLSGINWNKNGDKLSYIKPISDEENILIVFNTNTLEKTEITKLYNFHSAYSMFTLEDSHIIILPINKNKDIIDVDVKLNRKKKLTFSGNIDKMKTSDNGVFFTEISNQAKQMKYLDLSINGLYNLPSTVIDINKIALIQDNIIYTHLDSSLFEESLMNTKYIEKIARTTNNAKDSFYIFDTKTQTESFIKSLNSGQQIDKFLSVSDDKNELIFSTIDNKYYKLELTK